MKRGLLKWCRSLKSKQSKWEGGPLVKKRLGSRAPEHVEVGSNRVEWSIKRLSKQVVVLETSCSRDNSREMKSEKKTLKQTFLALEIISAVSWVQGSTQHYRTCFRGIVMGDGLYNARGCS